MVVAAPTMDDEPGALTAVETSVGATSCDWDVASYVGDGSGQPAFSVAVYPGAAWYLSTYRAAIDATTVSIPGVTDAIEIDPHPGEDFQRTGDVLAVADGVDLVTVSWQNVNFTMKSSVIPTVLAVLKQK
jgi:hypothetical protein